MCIAIMKPAGKEISKEVLKRCATANKDGCGFAYINESYTGVRKIFVKKSLDFETFYRQYERATRVNPESPFLIHFRIKTHGPINKDNCHPFMIDDEKVFIHNGIISGVGFDKEKSDTRLFNEKILQNLPEGWESNEAIKKLVEDFISMSKIVTMNIDGDIQIFNEHKGEWNDGIWYSNTSYKPPVTYTTYYTNQSSSTRRPRYYVGKWSQFACDSCQHPFRADEMRHFIPTVGGLNLPESYCKACAKEELDKYLLFDDDEITIEDFIRYMNK